MAKIPSFQFYPGDWMKDPSVAVCSPATRGVWVDFLCAMHELSRSGQLTGTREQLSRIGRCTVTELDQVLVELKTSKTANVNIREGIVNITNRRMLREAKARKASRLCMQEKRREEDVNSKLKESEIPSSSSSSSSKNNIKNKRVTITHFLKPTPVEISEYSKSIGFNLDGQKFCDYYEAKGWLVGKSPMKSWQAAVRTWKSNTDQNTSQIPTVKKYDNKKSFEQARDEILAKLNEADKAGGDSISRCLSVCNDLYRDIPKRDGVTVVNNAYEIFKFRRTK